MLWFNRYTIESVMKLKSSLDIRDDTESAEEGSNDVSRLPLELQTMVITQLHAVDDRDTLKTLRLVNHGVGFAATSTLFREVHFSANQLSYDRLKNIAANPDLARHVRRLIFHRGSWETEQSDVFSTSPAQEPSILDSFPFYRETKAKRNFYGRGRFVLSPQLSSRAHNRLDQNFAEEVRAQHNFRSGWMSNLLQNSAGEEAFPRLSEIYFPRWEHGKNSEYHVRRTGRIQTNDTDGWFHLYTILHSIKQMHNLRVLDLQDVMIDRLWPFSVGSQRESLSSLLGHLEVLRLGFDQGAQYPVRPGYFQPTSVLHEAYDGLRNLLEASALTLKELSLSVGRRTLLTINAPSGHREEQLDITRIITEIEFPRLVSLQLVDFAIDEDTFLKFLSQHRETLKVLDINNWVMPVSASSRSTSSADRTLKTSTSSITRAMWKIPQLTTLDEVHLQGAFTTIDENGLDSPCLWRSNASSSSTDHGSRSADNQISCLAESANTDRQAATNRRKRPMLTRMESYLARRGSFPFSGEVRQQLESDRYDFDDEFEASLRTPTDDVSGWTWTFDSHPDVIACQDASWAYTSPETGEARAD